MTFDEELEKGIAEIIGELECPKAFRCYRSGFENLCKAKVAWHWSTIIFGNLEEIETVKNLDQLQNHSLHDEWHEPPYLGINK